MKPVTLGLIVGNRGFFPSHLCETGREEMIQTTGRRRLQGHRTGAGGYSLRQRREPGGCAQVRRPVRRTSQGDRRRAGDAAQLRRRARRGQHAALGGPGRAGADPGLPRRWRDSMTIADRRDSFCGKMSVCNNLRQYGIPYHADAAAHGRARRDPSFQQDLADFAAICRVTSGLRNLRIGALGARPPAFNTVRYSEKLLEQNGITVETLDLFELFGRVDAMADDDAAVQAKLERDPGLRGDGRTCPHESLMKMAKFGAAVDNWMTTNELQASRDPVLDGDGRVLRRRALHGDEHDEQQADAQRLRGGHHGHGRHVDAGAGEPGCPAPWSTGTTTTATTRTRAWSSTAATCPRTSSAGRRRQPGDGLPGDHRRHRRQGEHLRHHLRPRRRPSPSPTCASSTDDGDGIMRAYVGEGEFTDDPLLTFGGYGVVQGAGLPGAAAVHLRERLRAPRDRQPVRTAGAVYEALTKYKGWDVYRHS